MSPRIIWSLSLLLAASSLLQVTLGISRVMGRINLIDYDVYYQAARTTLEGNNPYTRSYGENILFNYPPSSLVVFVPFALLPQSISQILFTIGSLVALITSLFLFLGSLPHPPAKPLQFLLLAFLVQHFATKFTLVMGQVNLFVLLFVVLAFTNSQKNNSLSSGLWWALATMIKATPVFLGLYFLVRRQWTALIVGMIGIVGSNIVFLIALPRNQNFFTTTIPQLALQTATTTAVYDQSLRAFLTRLGMTGTSPLISLLIIALLTFSTLIWYLRSAKGALYPYRNHIFFSLLLLLVTIGNSYTWQHHLVFLFPGYLTLTASTMRTKNIRLAILLFISFLATAVHVPDPAHPPTMNPLLISHALLGSLLLAGLLLSSLRGKTTPA